MDRLEPAALVPAILAAPGWARVGITMPNERLRRDAAEALAEAIVAGLDWPDSIEGQLPLPLRF